MLKLKFLEKSGEFHVFLKPTIFPDKTSQVWKIPELDAYQGRVDVCWSFENECEIMHLCQLAELLGVRKRNLHMGYLPYGRQDKEVSNKGCFALRSFAKIINSLGFASVTSLNVHNPEASRELINNLVCLEDTDIDKLIASGFEIICYPDKGAVERYSRLFNLPWVSFNKVRDQETGNITSMEFNNELDVEGCNVLIYDDICDGGRTFVEATKLLKEKGAVKVGLHVTHGLYTRGVRYLKENGIDVISCSSASSQS